MHATTVLKKRPKVGSVGEFATSTGKKFMLLDPESREPVPDGKPGELFIRGASYTSLMNI